MPETSDGNAAKIEGQGAGRCIFLRGPEIPPIPPRPGRLGQHGQLEAWPWNERRERESDLVDPRCTVETVIPGGLPSEGGVLDNASPAVAEPIGRTNVGSRNFN